MASRRTRIKMVAKIPQGRKNNAKDIDDETPTESNNVVTTTTNDVIINCTNSLVIDNNTSTVVTANTNNVVNSSSVTVDSGTENPPLPASPRKMNHAIKNTISTVVTKNKSTVANNSTNTGNSDTENPPPEASPSKVNCAIDGTKSTVVTSNTSTVINSISVTVNSDTEYPPPPPSPSKINRTRIKAIPRLDYRKTSFSASESEDESRKNSRIRNDSVCSTTSALAESVTSCMSPQRHREISSAVPKKCIRSEQTRKLAEARREFQRKFGLNKPERNKLTMMDLIFYNPDSNPMVRDAERNHVADPQEKKNVAEVNVEENEPPDETSQNDKENNDEENAMPVPQIKIGPSGEIIIDEQSLVIERQEVIKQREEMANTEIINGDFDTGYGVYKKHKRGKKWSHQETVRFYKAINTIGTDFTLMRELFPNRTRRELKMKFKKEENSNEVLMNRAVMQPGNFDFDELKNEVELEVKEFEEMQKQRELELKQNEEDRRLKQEKMAKRAEKRKLEQMEKEAIVHLNKPPKTKPSNEKPQPPPLKKSRKAPKAKKSFIEESDADESDLATQSESEDDEIITHQGPTRSGRIPKTTRKYQDEVASVQSIISKSKTPVKLNADSIEPGSIMIVTEEGASGDPVYKIFMVTAEKNAEQLEVSGDVIAKVVDMNGAGKEHSGAGVSAKNIMTISATVTDDENDAAVDENNVTIAAEDNVTTMKEVENNDGRD